jgi:enoyl-CoA hydratase/carnithine racemase
MEKRENLIVTRKEALCTVTINNPEKRNALNPECLFEIARTFDDLACDIRIASRNVKMGIPTSRMGLLSGYRGFKRFLTVGGRL